MKVIAGESLGVKSKIYTRTPTFYLDVTMKESASFNQEIDSEFNTFVYVIEGEALFGKNDAKGEAHNLLLTARDGEGLQVKTQDKGVRFVLIGGKPLNEPVAQHGPFVMSNSIELRQAMEDYRVGYAICFLY